MPVAAHVPNAGINVYLLDVAPQELTPEEAKGLDLEHPAVRNRIVNQDWELCLKARPASFCEAIHDYVPGGRLLRALIYNGICMADVEPAVQVIAETMNR